MNSPMCGETAATSGAQTETSVGAATPLRILLVEDERPFRELLEAFLTAQGYAVNAAPDGRQAARWLATHPVDLVITDLCMPESDGMQLVMQLRRTHGSVPIIVMSGGVAGHMAGMLRAAELMGARRTLSKPFPLQELSAAVAQVLRQTD
jgi:DNA-binding response OmpR family regulator